MKTYIKNINYFFFILLILFFGCKKDNSDQVEEIRDLSEQTIADAPALQQQVQDFTPTEKTLGLLDRPAETTEQNLLDRR